MKQFIWMLCGIFVSGLLLGTLSACGAEPLKIPYRHLEEVSISDLGCPRPEVTYPKPVG